VIGTATFDTEYPSAQARAEHAMLALPELPVMIGTPAPQPSPEQPAAPEATAVPPTPRTQEPRR